ncbi:MAG: hypothetical protein UX08_C0022G0007 [Candidatus Collierbacteria bacterium GW2011_GWB1_45_35]|uniref:Uncharacterized protein n=1 Tax=Candidatus Collierbacteria bacterium GW2011_GWA2_44_99 TaxID=1618380 RepID=A0A0G1KRI9_9BACT|nr:MAG: hypothetical protein UW84_C0014G0003 [Candidatus Collierbacteria bacterium GW2011_GWA2_44_99]KKU04569.1 MAG: hypothetical protein UX08_C0022G0007 [Candidatus Collierbacteria bacterium GW2011_GWB1_45_35]KKU07042.1 MAG: hypothetical protein UX11_C0021G0007 [Candidatus Collierbacteria bacterium GW2011_GWC2_45_40]
MGVAVGSRTTGVAVEGTAGWVCRILISLVGEAAAVGEMSFEKSQAEIKMTRSRSVKRV